MTRTNYIGYYCSRNWGKPEIATVFFSQTNETINFHSVCDNRTRNTKFLQASYILWAWAAYITQSRHEKAKKESILRSFETWKTWSAKNIPILRSRIQKMPLTRFSCFLFSSGFPSSSCDTMSKWKHHQIELQIIQKWIKFLNYGQSQAYSHQETT